MSAEESLSNKLVFTLTYRDTALGSTKLRLSGGGVIESEVMLDVSGRVLERVEETCREGKTLSVEELGGAALSFRLA